MGKVVVSSVVPAKDSVILKAAGKAKVLWLDWKLKLGVEIDYPKPQSIGADRLANAAAVTALYGFPAIVVDFGTAVTFDIVSGHRAYIGGVIAPGLEAMTNFLYQRTALLPKLSLKEPRHAIGKSTIQAMLSGAVFGYRGLVREILAQIRAEQFPRKKVHVVATGGYARLIARTIAGDRCRSIRTLLWKDYGLWQISMTDLRRTVQSRLGYSMYRFFRREPKNRFTGATFHLSDALNRVSIATS